MKKIIFLLSLCLLVHQYDAAAQKKASQTVKDRSYSYGAMLSQGIGAAGLNAEEKNIDQLIEGMKVGLKGDSATFATSQEIFRTRMQSREAATTAEEGAKIAYNIGISVIGGLAVEIDIPATDFDFTEFKKGFQDADGGKETRLEKPAMDSILNAYFQPLTLRYNKIMEEKKMAQSAGAIKEGQAFLEKNGKREGVVTLPSGLQYEIIKKGTGNKPTIADKVKTHYHGTLIDGSVFDSSVERGEPATFGVGQVIKGWQEGIPLMSPGAKYKFYIPQELAYGANPQPGSIIEPYMPLVFEVELLEILDGPVIKNVEKAPLTSMKFDKMKHDFGNVKADTDNKTYFTVTNTGNNPLIIESVKASCGCTTPSKPEKPIMPGKSDKIEVVFHPKENQLKEQKKTVRVVANTTPGELVLNVRAFVEKK